MRRAGLYFGVILILAVAGLAILAPWIRPYDPSTFDLSLRLAPERHGYPFGFDEEGRDLFSLVLWGARVSLVISLSAVFLSTLIGTLIGIAAGYWGGRWDAAFVFVTDVILAFPSILLIIAVAAFQREGGIVSVVVILSAVGWVGTARLVRGLVFSLKEREFVLAARGSGASHRRIWVRHLLPNLVPPLLIQATFGMAGVILAESTLSFLGLGVPFDVPSWGRLLDQGVQYLLVAPHLSLYPGLAIALLILGFNFLGDGLRDALDVRERKY